jgi:hypothetical protein
MMAGATAVPLTPPEHKVLFQPTPETTTPSDPGTLKPLAQQDSSVDEAAVKPADSAVQQPAAAAAGGGDGAAIPMQPLPTAAASAAGTSKHTEYHQQQQQQGVVLPDSSTPAAEGPVCRTLDQVMQQQQQQVQHMQTAQQRHRKTPAAPTAAAAAAAAAAPGKLMTVSKPEMADIMSQLDKQPHRQQHHQQSYKPTSSRITPSFSSSAPAANRRAKSSSSSSSSRSIKSWLQRKWQSGREKAGQKLEDAAAWALSMLWLWLCWLGRLLLTPLTAVFGPWYRYNRCVTGAPVLLVGNRNKRMIAVCWCWICCISWLGCVWALVPL